MKLLLVAHGASHSTLDIYKYYASAFKYNGVNTRSFPYHDVLEYHAHAVKAMSTTEDIRKEKTLFGAAREVIAEISMQLPDWVIFINGMAIPSVFSQAIYNLRSHFIKPYKIGYLFTESPYQDAEQIKYMQYSDAAWFNDRNTVKKLNPDNELFIFYLPHSYDSSIHYSYLDLTKKSVDVIFCGTPYHERAEILSQVDWSNINFQMYGPWDATCNDEFKNKLFPYIVENNPIANESLANLYRESRIAINIHRQRESIDEGSPFASNPHSMNPRIREALMCGALVITDYREEVKEVFGDLLPVWNNPAEIQEICNYYLNNENERIELVNACRDKIISHSYTNRVKNDILPVMEELEEIYG